MDNQTNTPAHDFGWALAELKAGRRVAREGWNGKGQYIELQVPDEHSKMTVPYTYIHTVQGDLVPWVPSQTDQFAEDWQIFSDEKEGGM